MITVELILPTLRLTQSQKSRHTIPGETKHFCFMRHCETFSEIFSKSLKALPSNSDFFLQQNEWLKVQKGRPFCAPIRSIFWVFRVL